jgi:hypothetical protein
LHKGRGWSLRDFLGGSCGLKFFFHRHLYNP